MAYFMTPDGCSLYYELLGQGSAKPTITFINGTLQTTIYWKPFCKSLADHFRLLIYDCRGQGASGLGEEPLTLRSMHPICNLSCMNWEFTRRTSLLSVMAQEWRWPCRTVIPNWLQGWCYAAFRHNRISAPK